MDRRKQCGRRVAGERRSGLGVRTMHFRAGAIGGTLVIESRRSQGSAVICLATLSAMAVDLPRETRDQAFIHKE